MAQDLSKYYSDIISRLNKVREKENRLILYSGIMFTSIVVIATSLISVICEQLFTFGIMGRTILFIISGLVIIVSLVWYIIIPSLYVAGILKRFDNRSLATKVGNHFPFIHDRLLDAIQIYENRDQLQQHYSVSLIDASFSDLYKQINSIDFTEAVNNSKVKRARKIVIYALAIMLLVVVSFPSDFMGSFYRIVNFNKSFASQLPIQLMVEPGNIEAVRGQSIPIKIRAIGKPIKHISFLTRQHGQLDFDRQQLNVDKGDMFSTSIENIKTTMEYYAATDEVKSEKFTINVIDRPIIKSLLLKVVPPAYTRLPAKNLEDNTGDVNGYPGSVIDIQVLSSKELSSSEMLFNDSTKKQLTITGQGADGKFSIKKNSSYHIFLKDKDGLTNIDPVEYTIKIIQDEYPSVEVVSPGKNVDLAGEMKLDLLIKIKDDFGFSNLRLAHRLVQSRFEKPSDDFSYFDIPITDKNQPQSDQLYNWNLSALNLAPEDVVSYYVEVFDNDNISGPKSARSQTYLLRLPSLEEVFSDVSDAHKQSDESLQNIAKETDQLKKDIEEFQREMKKSSDKMDWQKQKKVDEITQRYEAIQKKLDETSQKMADMLKKMDENKLLSDETMQKYIELQKLMEKLNSPELRDALKKLQESAKQLSPDQMKQSMEQLKITEEQFRESLERTIDLLKRIHIEQKLDELLKRTEELIKQQESLKRQVSKTDKSDQQKRNNLSEQQEELQKQLEKLEKETASLKEKMEEFPKEMPIEDISKAEQKLQKNQTGKKMKQAQMQMKSGDMQAAQQNQEESKEDLEEFKKQLDQTMKSLLDKQMKQIVNEMRKQIENILETSKEEEELKDNTKNLDPNSQRFRENTQKQNEIMNNLDNIANAMTELSKKTFAISPEMGKEIGNAIRQMSSALNQMVLRNPAGSSQKQSEAMGSLNRAAEMMQEALGNMMQGGKSGMGMAGLMARLEQMMGMQGSINSATQQAMGNGQGQQLSAQQQAEYQRLAGQQGSAQKSLEELAREAKNAGEYSRLLGDLDRITEDMKEVQTDLLQGNVNPNTIQKQERILSRLLESSRSMRERDYEKKRRAEAGKDILRPSPADLDLSTQEGKNKLRDELLKALEGKYTKDYEEIIRKYFERLEKENINR